MELMMDIFAYFGMAVLACTVTIFIFNVSTEISERKKFRREMDEFNQAMKVATEYWKDRDGKQ